MITKLITYNQTVHILYVVSDIKETGTQMKRLVDYVTSAAEGD